MGNGGSSIGDLFFSDNPDRRRRAEELRDQINAFGAEFRQLKAQREQKIDGMRDKLDDLMQSKGFATTEQLEDHVRSILESDALRDYDSLKQGLDLSDKIQGILFDAISIVGAGSGVILGVGVLAGIVTGGAAIAALGVIGEILAAVAAMVIVFGVIEGAIERDRLREAIRELWPKRAQIKQAVEQMRVVVNWVDALDIWLNNPVTNNPATLDALLNGSFEPDYRSWTIWHTCDVLLAQDNRNESWTEEDPDPDVFGPIAVMLPNPHFEPIAMPAVAPIMVTAAETTEIGAKHENPPVAELEMREIGGAHAHHEQDCKVIYRKLLAKDACLVELDGQLVKITATRADEKHAKLDSTLFRMQPSDNDVAASGGGKEAHVAAAEESNAASRISRTGRRFTPIDCCTIRVISCSVS